MWPARTPFQGNSEITVVGKNFLPSRYLKCKFGGYTAEGAYVAEDTSHIVGGAGGRARYVSSTEIICVTPTYGPASQREQFPHCYTTAGGREICYPSKVPGSGAVLEVGSFSMGGSISRIDVLRAGHGYASSPLVTVVGGGGCCASLNATLDEEGRIASVDVLDGGKNFNMGEGAQLTPVLSGGDGGGSQCLG